MSAWRRKAIEAAPDLRDCLERAWSPMAAWIELHLHFETVVKAGEMDKARRIMDHARDCMASANRDITTAVANAFIEHLAEDKSIRARLPEIMKAQDVQAWRVLMAYHSDEKTIADLEAACREHRPRSKRS
ncbi:hypothetical protein GAO09_16095 [Rhizobiales bacterium RZME27]|jgi:hypothetical protein|uniref:DUF7674 domain-containing protein n=1 Tax=Endobacterium cereale TaxID=2663029 RepID=A0A6A8ACB9_9HYPH|nr:hypothetical protein [Endobacterium cereale]MEB2847025.1 hypothetical protein [Endobacterium cereale]MQY47557.1 hypothetical protein [Endobacterium cereale]